ncbi:preprotein translocase subunit SecE [Buchnera aphidicola (Mollitrichosiphum nigrofasciatum)]|uniref:preprotein translocase subunit SecE n=1 Tax=Buchnera aphidicola TaxID=9 RepID=UPI0031B7F042
MSKKIFTLINKLKNEINKIVWPNAKETLYTTLMICVITITVSLLLWGIDNILFYITSLIINFRF